MANRPPTARRASNGKGIDRRRRDTDPGVTTTSPRPARIIDGPIGQSLPQPPSVDKSVLLSSDFVEDSCVDCLNKRNLDKMATNKCSQCKDNFCRRCFRHHIQKVCLGPGNESVNKNIPICQVKCERHHRLIDSYCESHGLPCCDCCASEHAKGNTDCKIMTLESYVRNIDTSDGEMVSLKKATYAKLNRRLQNVADKMKLVQRSMSNVQASEHKALDDIEEFTKALVQKILQDKEALIEDVRESVRVKLQELDDIGWKCKREIGTMTKDMQTLGQPKASNTSPADDFVDLKLIANRMKYQNNTISSNSMAETVEFRRNEDFVQLVHGRGAIGNVSLCLNNERAIPEQCFGTQELQTVRYKPFMSSWMSGDQVTDTCVSAMVTVDDVTILLADQGNNRLKLFRIGSNVLEPLHFLSLEHSPYCICPTGSDTTQYFVSIPVAQTIQAVTVSDNRIRMDRWKIELAVDCVGIVRVGHRMIVSAYAEEKCQLMSVDLWTNETNILYEQTDTNKSLTLSRPDYLSKTSDEKILIVSDADEGVFGISTRDFSTVVFHVNDMTLRCSLGLTVDVSGRIYVCGNQSYTIHCLSVDDQRLIDLGGRETFQTRKPQSVVHLKQSKELLVSFDNSYDIFCLLGFQ